MSHLFACSICGSALRITTTRRVCRGRIVRYRKCSKCGNREKTEEIQKAVKSKSLLLQ